jgi:DNA-binding Lrp family transcriptional regulator
MVTAIVLVDIEPAEIPEAAQAIADLPGVQAVYSCAGDVDVIAVVNADDHEGIASIIPEHIAKVRGVRSTVTHIAFRSYSRRDSEDAFSIGMQA